MMDAGKVKQIIRDAISTALLIDDEYGNPFAETEKDLTNSRLMYKSFKEEGQCLLDIYSYDTYDKFNEIKERLFSNHELLILDWELQNGGKDQSYDTLRVLSHVVQETGIRFIVIYTNAPDTYGILYEILTNFSDSTIEKDRIKELTDAVKDILDEEEIELDIDQFLSESACINGYSLDKIKRSDREKDFKASLTSQLGSNCGRFCQQFNKKAVPLNFSSKTDLPKFMQSLDYIHHEKTKYKDLPKLRIQSINMDSLQLNNTVVTVIKKRNADQGVKPEDLFGKIVETLISIPNHASLLFSLKLRTSLYKELGRIGRSIGVIDEGALLRQAKTYTDENDLSNYISTCTSCIVEDIIRKDVETHDYKELFENTSEECNDLSFIQLNRLLTFSSKSDMFSGEHLLTQGDVFLLDKPIAKDMKYLICISAVCDCAHTEDKPAFFHSFAIGNVTSSKEALEGAEKDIYTFVDDNTPVKWSKYFLTINMTDNIHFDINKPITIYLGKEDVRTMEYVGNVKRLYAQRIANNVFTYAARIGVDLPHTKKSNR
jgi:hypothetical protein